MGRRGDVTAFGERIQPGFLAKSSKLCVSVSAHNRNKLWQSHVCYSKSLFAWAATVHSSVFKSVCVRNECLCNEYAVMCKICMLSASVCERVCVSLMTAGWLSCCIVMSYGCLSGSCSDKLFSQVALPHTYTQVRTCIFFVRRHKETNALLSELTTASVCCSCCRWQSCANAENNNWVMHWQGGGSCNNARCFPKPELTATLPPLQALLCFHPDADGHAGITDISWLKLLIIGQISATAQRARCASVCVCTYTMPPPPLFCYRFLQGNKMDVCA